VDGFDRGAGELELATRLERNRAAAGHVRKADDVRPIHDRLPAEQVLHADQQRMDRALPVIGHRIVAVGREREFLVLRADAEPGFRLCTLFEPGDQLVARFDGRQVDDVTGHVRRFRRKRARPYTRPARKGNAG
jgi:hypothetical protein